MPHEWDRVLDELERRRREARAMGGPERLERQRARGRLNARERLAALLDDGSFNEIGALVGGQGGPGGAAVAADAFVCGSGRIEGRPVLVGAEDFTSRGGSIGPGTHAKRFRIVDLAAQERVPLVMLLEGAGERVTNALERRGYAPNDLQALAALSGAVPTLCLVMGPSAGHGALTAPLMDFVVMVEGAALFSAGPPLVQASIGESVTIEELGGARVHTEESGVAHNAVPTEQDALALARRYLSFFPSSAWQHPPDLAGPLEEPRPLERMLELVHPEGRKPYDMREVVELLLDAGSALEIQPWFGSSMLTLLGRLGGRVVAIVANQPLVRGGAIDRQAADKAARFLEIASAFHIPVIFLADNPGVMAGSAAEREGALRAAARLFFAQSKLQVPKLHVTLRKAFGFGSSVMAMNPFDRQTTTLALPTATLGAMPAAGGATAAGLDRELRGELEASESLGPWASADTLAYDEVVDPRELRSALLAALTLSRGRRDGPAGPSRRSGVRP